MPYVEVDGLNLYYEWLGPVDAPVVLQIGGPLLGRKNFDRPNELFAQRFRILSYDASGYGRSSHPHEAYEVLAWAEEAAGLLDALAVDRALVHGTSLGGMIGLALATLHPDKVVALCADCTFARPDALRKQSLRLWRRIVDAMSLEDFCDLLATQTVSASYYEANPDIGQQLHAMISTTSPFTFRQSCLARERMDLESLARTLSRPTLFTNGENDVLMPARLGPSGFSALDVVAASPRWARSHIFPGIQHAGLIECLDEAFDVVSTFFEESQ